MGVLTVVHSHLTIHHAVLKLFFLFFFTRELYAAHLISLMRAFGASGENCWVLPKIFVYGTFFNQEAYSFTVKKKSCLALTCATLGSRMNNCSTHLARVNEQTFIQSSKELLSQASPCGKHSYSRLPWLLLTVSSPSPCT